MSALTEFLLARIAEDEAVARDAGGDEWREADVEYGREAYSGLQVYRRNGRPIAEAYLLDATLGRHIARHDPARVLAECAAKRAIVAEHVAYFEVCAVCYDQDASSPGDFVMKAYPCDTLRALASVYADHPDYRSEWAP